MDRKSILGFVLIFIIIMLLPFYYRLISPQPETGQVASPESHALPTKTTTGTADSAAIIKNTTPRLPSFDAAQETILTIESELYKITLSSLGGGTIKSILLKQYFRSLDNDTDYVQLVPAVNAHPLLIKYVDLNGDSVTVTNHFTVIAQPDLLPRHYQLAANDSLTLTFLLRDQQQTLIQRSLTFYGNRYLINQHLDLTGIRSQIANDQFDLSWEGGLTYTEKMIKDEALYTKAHAYTGGDIENLDVKAGKSSQSKFVGATSWSAIRTKYFTVAFIPAKPALGFKLTGYTYPLAGREYQKVFNMYLTLPADQPVVTQLYFGPLDFSNLKSFNIDLENIMNFGASIIRPISKFFLWSFIELHRLIPNYGWGLIIFSILIKIILTPLTNISTRSMKEMQHIQPQIMALREKYASDPQKLNAETMRLYREHGVNPMGGCLPLLLQLPILWALFIVFRTTIELRHAHFIFWIRDLSAPDTIFTLPFSIPLYGNQVNVLPILMVISQIIQQKLSGATANQQQKLSMWLMTIFFFFLFNQFPAGLNLYYTLFNILAILQQKYFPPKPKPKKPRKSTKELLRQLQQRNRRRFK